MVISFGLWSALPDTFGPDIFWKDIPKWLGTFENFFRILAFGLPGVLYFGKKEIIQTLGWYLYLGGLVGGIGFLCARSWLPIRWHRAIYFLSATIFLTLHTGQTWLVYSNLDQ